VAHSLAGPPPVGVVRAGGGGSDADAEVVRGLERAPWRPSLGQPVHVEGAGEAGLVGQLDLDGVGDEAVGRRQPNLAPHLQEETGCPRLTKGSSNGSY
jgi:hypothetical protein